MHRVLVELSLLRHLGASCLPRCPVTAHKGLQRQRGNVLHALDNQPAATETGISKIQNTVSHPLTRRMNTGSPCTDAHSEPMTVIRRMYPRRYMLRAALSNLVY